MKPTVSIIVPIYNVEEYIEKCIESIINQSHKNYELLLINDGSPDNSGEICKKFEIDSRIKYHKKENGGVSSARNLGIKLSKGKYISFIDPDDYISNHYLEKFINQIKPSSLIIQDFNFDNNGDIIYNHQNYINKTIKLPEEIIYYLSDYRITQGYLWNKIFEKEIIINNNILFNEKIKICQDEDFCSRYVQHVKQIIISDECNYFYVQRDSSATTKIPTFESEFTRLESYLTFLDFLKNHSKNHSNESEIKNYIRMRFNFLFNYTLRTTLYKNIYSKKKRIASLKIMSKLDKTYLNLLEGKTFLKKIDYLLFKNNLFHVLDFILYNKSKYNS